MHVFVTGASGWIGSAVVDELLANGHEVTGLVRSDAAADAVAAKGARALRGDLDDLDSLRSGARDAEGVVHLANKHDFSDPAVSNRAERTAVETLGDELAGSGRPLVLASGVAGLRADGGLGTEHDPSRATGPDSPRGGSENRALEYVEQNVRVVSARFAPTVHGQGDHGFIRVIADVARERGAAGYIGDGSNRWAAVHRADAARLVRLGLEQAPAGSLLHAVAEVGISARDIAEAIGAGLGVPVRSIAPDEAQEHFGWIGGFFGMDLAASSAITRQLLPWTPTGPTLLDDLQPGSRYFEP